MAFVSYARSDKTCFGQFHAFKDVETLDGVMRFDSGQVEAKWIP